MKEFYGKTPEQVLGSMGVDERGLLPEEALKRIEEHGYNELNQAEKDSLIKIFTNQFRDFIVYILLGAAIVSIVLAKYESAGVILAVIILNSVLGTVQFVKAEKSLESLKNLSAPMAKVIRDGFRKEIPSRNIVPGDILYVEAGDFICADARIIEAHSLQVNESSLTGESAGINKMVEIITGTGVSIGDRTNMVHSGSYVTYGRGTAVVTATGMNTEIGRIASLLDQVKARKTPLQISLDKFGQKLTIAILVLCGIIFVVNSLRGVGIGESFTFAVALAVAAVPEALSSIVTIVLAIGTRKMAKENAIIRKLHAVESLGCVSVICSDKTGTLTQNKMTVMKLFSEGKIYHSSDHPGFSPFTKKMVLHSLLCNDAITQEDRSFGDATELALVNFGEILDMDELKVRGLYPRLSELPFDSQRKLMSTLHSIDGGFTILTKGAVDVMLKRSSYIELPEGVRTITGDDLEKIEEVNREFSQNGLRVLAFASKDLEAQKELNFEDEYGLTFQGLIAMIDPPRPETIEAVATCRKAGLKPVMITGDHKITAMAIAKEVGIYRQEDGVLEGYELDRINDDELGKQVTGTSVYARVSPEHKIRIVKAWQSHGEIVAMTGDGVNDAPALAQADIGVAMGIAGTEVAKDAASMVLTDDNFATIVKAISNGRAIYSNIKKSIKFLLSGNMAAILAVIYASVANLPLPFAAVQLLFINLITDSLPAIALGMEPPEDNAMSKKPRSINEPILTRKYITEIIIEGAIIGAATMGAFYYGREYGGATLASTMAFSTLCLARLFHGFNCRSDRPVFLVGIFKNKLVWAALIIGAILLTIVLTLGPAQSVFEVDKDVASKLGVVAGFAVLPLFVIQGLKSLMYKLSPNK